MRVKPPAHSVGHQAVCHTFDTGLTDNSASMNTADILAAAPLSEPVHAPKVRWKPNVTVAAVIEHEGRFLLVEEDTSDGLLLNNPAGHLDPGESPIDACVREALEETGRRFTPEGFLGMYMSASGAPAPARTSPTCAWPSSVRSRKPIRCWNWTTASCAPCG